VEDSINEENVYAKQGSEVWDMTKIKQPGRRYVNKGGGEKPMKCEARENEKLWQEEGSGRDEINITACSFLRALS
jgi:hypothetical protein